MGLPLKWIQAGEPLESGDVQSVRIRIGIGATSMPGLRPSPVE
jgi:hypothetical protein